MEYKEIFTQKEIAEIMDRAMESDALPKTSPELAETFKGIHAAIMNYLDKYETHTFMWAYNLGYAAAMQKMEGSKK